MGYGYCVRCDQSFSEGYCRCCRDSERSDAESDAVADLARAVWAAAGIPDQKPAECRSCKRRIYFLPIHWPGASGKRRWCWVPISSNGTRHACEPGQRPATHSTGAVVEPDWVPPGVDVLRD